MNSLQNVMSDIQNKLVAVESDIRASKESCLEESSMEKINDKITEVKQLALLLPKYYPDNGGGIKRDVYHIIRDDISALGTKSLNNLKNDIQFAINRIQLYFSPDSSFNTLDHECIWICPTFIRLARAAMTRMVIREFGTEVSQAMVGNDYMIYDWLLKLAIGEILMPETSSYIVARELPPGKPREWMEELLKEGIAILKNESDKLQYTTYPELRLRYKKIENSLIPQFHGLCQTLLEEAAKIKDPSIGANVCDLLLGKELVNCKEEEIVQGIAKTIKSIEQLLTCNNRDMFCSLTKLALASNFVEAKRETVSLKLTHFLLNCNQIPFPQSFESYQKILSLGLQNQEYYSLQKAMGSHPGLSSASLEQILFLIQKDGFFPKNLMAHVAEKGILSYPGVDLLSYWNYSTLFRVAIEFNWSSVCNDLMQLKQYQRFSPNEGGFESVIQEALNKKNSSVFESLMNHPAFFKQSRRELEKCLDKVKEIVQDEGGDWNRILSKFLA